MSLPRFHRLRAILERRQTSLTVLMENVHKPHNLSAVLRSCDAVGVFEAHAIDASGTLQTYWMTSGSAAKWVGVRVHPDVGAAVRALRSAGFTIAAAHLGEGAVDFRAYDYTRPTAVLLGAEKDGVTQAALALAQAQLRIPMHGAVQSLNVSVAAAVILFEAQRQRRARGLYDRRQLPDDLYGRLLFEWTYPEIAAHCRSRGAPYPELDADGEIVGSFPR